jgi:hypothetical protein
MSEGIGSFLIGRGGQPALSGSEGGIAMLAMPSVAGNSR